MLPCFGDRCLGGVAPSVYGHGHGGHGGHGGGHGGVASPSPAMRMSPSASSHPEERLLKPWMQRPGDQADQVSCLFDDGLS